METLSKDLLSMILEYCDNFKDYRNWSLISKKWNSLMKVSIRNILTVILNDEMINLNYPNIFDIPQTRLVRQFYISPGDEIVLDSDKSIHSLHFIWWATNIINHSIIVQFYTKNVLKSTIDLLIWRHAHPYNFGSNMLKCQSTGFICTKYLMKDVDIFDRIVFKNIDNSPFLIAYKY